MIDQRPVGLWMLPAHVGTSRSALAALQREFAQLRTLDHPNIARLLELGRNGQQYYVTGERLDGEPLRQVLTHLAPERLEIGDADDVVRALGSALCYAHERDIMHGDVRAENVLVTMNRRFVLTNFLARRVAKVAGRPPRPSDDLRGLARLAAELYTGSTSTQALRGTVHGEVPAARLNAIRAVFEATPNRRVDSVAEFLATAGLAFAGAGAAATRRAREPARSWSIWRLVVPLFGVVAIGAGVAAYHGAAAGDWRSSAAALQRNGLEALRSVTTRAAGRAPAEAAVTARPKPAPASQTAAAPLVAAPDTAKTADEPAAPPTQPATVPTKEPEPAAGTPSSPVGRATDPTVLSLGVTRIAAREDHSVVAIEVVRSGDTTHETAVGWWTTPDTAHEEDDYARAGRQTVTFPAGATVGRVLIPIVNDGVRESDEVFTVHLSRARDAVAGPVTATRVTLHDDD